MRYKRIDDHWIIILEKDERIMKKLTEFIRKKKIKSGYFNAIGAISAVKLAHYNLGKKEYRTRSFKEPLEIISLIGNVAIKGKEIIIHPHIAVGRDNMQLYGGHLKEATVAATCEVIFREFKEGIHREYNENIGLNLIKLEGQ